MYLLSGMVRWNQDREKQSIEEDDRTGMRGRGTSRDKPGILRCYAPDLRSSVNQLSQEVYHKDVVPGRVMGEYTGICSCIMSSTYSVMLGVSVS